MSRAVHKLLVLYPHPTDPAAFREYYESVHLPLAAKMPNLLAWRYSLAVDAVGGDSPYFAVFEADFASEADLGAAMSSEAGQAVQADVPNYATGGAVVLHYDVGP